MIYVERLLLILRDYRKSDATEVSVTEKDFLFVDSIQRTMPEQEKALREQLLIRRNNFCLYRLNISQIVKTVRTALFNMQFGAGITA